MNKELSEEEIRKSFFDGFESDPEFQKQTMGLFNYYCSPIQEQYKNDPMLTVEDVALNAFLYGIVAGNAFLSITDTPEGGEAN